MKRLLIGSALAVGIGTVLSAQATPPAPAPAPAPPRAPARSTTSSSTLTLSVQVTDKSGNGVGDVAVAVTGPVDRSGRTAADGSVAFRSMRGGTYRLRFEHERYITLERDILVGPRATEVSVALNPAPVTKAPVVAPPAVTAPPVQQAQRRAIEPHALSMVAFLDKNLIGSEPQKSSLLACSDGGTARLLQVKEPVTNQVNADADQLLYVVAGSGVVRVREQEHKASSGLFVVIPRGVPLGARREGRNPLIALTVTLGAACAETAPLAK